MPDWNKDGKSDWHDDYVINEIIPDKTGKQQSSNNRSSGPGCTIGFLIAAAVIWGIINLLADLKY